MDASALTNALLDDDRLGRVAREALQEDDRWSAPEHVVVETFSAVRGRVLGGKVSVERGEETVAALATARIDLVSVSRLLGEMWAMRENIGAHDSA